MIVAKEMAESVHYQSVNVSLSSPPLSPWVAIHLVRVVADDSKILHPTSGWEVFRIELVLVREICMDLPALEMSI